MRFTPNVLRNILNVIDYNHIVFSLQTVGSRPLSKEDIALLKRFGLNPEEVVKKYPSIFKSFHWGRLSAILRDKAAQINYIDFMNYLQKGQYIPLSEQEETVLEYVENKSYSHIKGLGERIKQTVSGVMVENDPALRAAYEDVIKDSIKTAVIERQSVSQVVSAIGHATGDWERDLGRIAETEMNTAFQHGRAEMIKREQGTDAQVFKDVFQGACFPVNDTEYLTNEGFKKLDEILGHEKIYSFNPESGHGEWVNIVSKIEYDYKGEMHHYKHKSMDLMSTPNHKHLIGKHYSKNKQSYYKNILIESSIAKDSPYRDIMHTTAKPSVDGYNEEYITICGKTVKTEIFAKFMGWWLSDGHIGFRRKKIKQGGSQMSMITITQLKEHNFQDIKEIFSAMFPDRNILRIGDKFVCNLDMSYDDLVQWFLKLGKAVTKYIPSELMNLNPRYLVLFLETFISGDGCFEKEAIGKKGKVIGGKLSCYTSSKRLADNLCEVIVRCGHSSTISIRDCIGATSYKKNGAPVTTRHLRYIVSVNKLKNVKNLQMHFHKIENWEGRVGCLELDKNFTLFIKRNGKTIFSGNCRHCIRLYLEGGIGSKPRVFTIKELIDNGINIGKKVNEWLATVSATHPWCRCTLREIPKGYVWDAEEKRFAPPKGVKDKYGLKGTIKVTVGDKIIYV